MAAEGLASLYPISEVAVMGPLAIARRLPLLLRRVHETVDAAVAFRPHALVIIDSPEFTHPIARRLRARLPAMPIVDYVSPSVWAWRPGRAPRMRAYVDHVLALLPFEPEAHARLGGPPCTYVGHPVIERLDWIRSRDAAALAARLGIAPSRPVVVVLPGSRRSEVGRLMQPFGDALRHAARRLGPLEVVVPAVDSVRTLIEQGARHWPIPPHIVRGDDDKFAAFRLGRAALAASGTVTLELALAGIPMVVAYRVERAVYPFRFLVKAPSIVLANLVLGENAFPELIQERCTGALLGAALADIVEEGAPRAAQEAALARIADRMRLPSGTPSAAAARIVLDLASRRA
jgi:lipid-A-disaccharide synthase